MKTKILNAINLDRITELLDGFYKITDLTTAIIDLEGNILSKSGWRQICTEFHRAKPASSKNCFISDTELANKFVKGEKYRIYNCLNELVNIVVPIVIAGEHVANLISGQFLFEKPDKSVFRNQAIKYGFEPDAYLNALDKVPLISKEKAQKAMDFLLSTTQLITDITLQKLKSEESEITFKKLFEESSDAILLINNTGVFTNCNQAALDLLKTTREQFINSTPASISPELQLNGHKSKELAVEMIQLANQNGLHRFDWVHINSENEEFIVEVSLMPIVINGQELLHVTWRNITQRIKTENELKIAKQNAEKSEIIKNKMISNISEVIVIIDKNGINQYKSPNITDLFGWLPEELIGKSTWDYIHPDDLDKVQDFFGKIESKPNSTGRIEVRFRRKDGIYVWIEINVINLINDQYIQGTLGNYCEITERKKAQKQLLEAKEQAEESEKRYRGLISNIETGVVVHAPDTSIILCNKRSSDLLGLSIEQMKGKEAVDPTWKFIYENLTSISLDDYPVMRIKHTKNAIKNQILGVQRQGFDIIWLLVNGFPILINNEISEIIISFNDITDIKLSEKALLVKMDELERFHALTIGRELTMIELKKEINNLLNRLGEDNKYRIVK